MNKRIISLFLIVILILTFVGTCTLGCNPNKVDQQDENDDNFQEESVEEIENGDILALSYNRLENADLSFNFQITSSVGSESVVAIGDLAEISNLSLSGESTSRREEYNTTYDKLINTEVSSVDYTTYNFFDEEQSMLDSLSNRAREIADYVIDNITVVDTFVNNGWINYMLSYDKKTDVVTAIYYNINEVEELDEFCKIQIYYDEDGEETVEMWRFINLTRFQTVGQTWHIIYTADKYYHISFNQWGYEAGKKFAGYNLSSAYKSDGKWRGVRYHFNKENPLIAGEGTINFDNGILYLEFMVETDVAIYTFSERLLPFRNGEPLYHGDNLLPDDEYRILQGMVNASGVFVNLTDNLITFDLSVITGWDEITMVLDMEYEFNSNPSSMNSRDDIFVLSNGTTLTYQDFWSSEYGWVSVINDNYLTKDGTNLSEQEIDWDNIVRLQDVMSFINDGEMGPVLMVLEFDSNDFNKSINLIIECFKDSGLGFVSAIPAGLLEDLALMQEFRTDYTNGIFNYLYGCDFEVEHLKEIYLELSDSLDIFENSIEEFIEQSNVISFEDIPKISESIELISLADKLKGKAVITSESIDFSGITLSVSSSPILSNGKTYGLIVGWTGKNNSILAESFETAQYEKKAMSFNGKSGVELPKAIEGEYTLRAFFGKITDDSFIRLSEVVNIPVVEFESFEVKIQAEGGYYSCVYFYESGCAGLKVKFVDTQAPIISFIESNGVTVEEGDLQTGLTFVNQANVSDLLSIIRVIDNVDGTIELSVENLSVDGNTLSNSVALVDGKIYSVSVRDAAGNIAVKKISVHIAG